MLFSLAFGLLIVPRITVVGNHVCKAVRPPILDDVTEVTVPPTTTAPGTICLPEDVNMISVPGVPDPTSVPFKKSTSDWTACQQTCSTDNSCMMVYQGDSGTDNCVIFNYGDVWRVKKEGGAKNVSIKVPKKFDTCFYTISDLFSADNTFNTVASSILNTYNIIADSSYFTFTYNNETLGLKGCNDFLQATPNCTAATSCLTTMIPYTGRPIAGWYSIVTRTLSTVSWKECMTVCYADPLCFLAQMTDGNSTCSLYKEGNVMYIDKSVGSANRIAMKIALPSSGKCPTSAQDVVSGRVYKTPSTFNVSSWYRLGSSDGFIGIIFDWSQACPIGGSSQKSSYMANGRVMSYFAQPQRINMSTSRQMCLSVGDGLLAIPSFAFAYNNHQYFMARAFSGCFNLQSQFRSTYQQRDKQNFFVGYTKKDGKWTWDLDYLVTDRSYNPWAIDFPKYPNDNTQNICAYENIPISIGRMNYLENGPCSEADGFFCHVPDYSL